MSMLDFRVFYTSGPLLRHSKPSNNPIWWATQLDRDAKAALEGWQKAADQHHGVGIYEAILAIPVRETPSNLSMGGRLLLIEQLIPLPITVDRYVSPKYRGRMNTSDESAKVNPQPIKVKEPLMAAEVWQKPIPYGEETPEQVKARWEAIRAACKASAGAA